MGRRKCGNKLRADELIGNAVGKYAWSEDGKRIYEILSVKKINTKSEIKWLRIKHKTVMGKRKGYIKEQKIRASGLYSYYVYDSPALAVLDL